MRPHIFDIGASRELNVFPAEDHPELPDRVRCGRLGGHEMHHIQARLSSEKPPVIGRVTDVTDGWIEIDTPIGVVRYWTHDPVWVQALIDRFGPDVEVRTQYVIAIPLAGASGNPYLVSVSDDPSPCGHRRSPRKTKKPATVKGTGTPAKKRGTPKSQPDKGRHGDSPRAQRGQE